MNVLDYTGLTELVTKIKNYVQNYVHNGTLTIKQNDTSKGTFTSNSSSDVTINLTDTTYSNATTSTAGLMSSSDKTKLDGIAADAEVNVQSDWDVTSTTSDAYIKNKPKNLDLQDQIVYYEHGSAVSGSYPNLIEHFNYNATSEGVNFFGCLSYRILLASPVEGYEFVKIYFYSTSNKITHCVCDNSKFTITVSQVQISESPNAYDIELIIKYCDTTIKQYVYSATMSLDIEEVLSMSKYYDKIPSYYASPEITKLTSWSHTSSEMEAIDCYYLSQAQSLSAGTNIEITSGNVINNTLTKTSQLTNDSNFKTTDENVKQTETSTSASYEMLFAGSTSSTTATEGAGKSSKITCNPSTGRMTTQGNNSGLRVYSTDGAYSTAFIVGTSGLYRGIYDYTFNDWVVFSDATTSYFKGNADTATKATQDANGLQIDTNYMLVSHGTSIPSGADLNDYTTLGVYYTSSSAITRSLLNTPSYIPNNARLEVFASSGSVGAGTYLYQRLYSNSATYMQCWIRCKTSDSGGWSVWHSLNENDYTRFCYDSTDYANNIYIKIAEWGISTSTTNVDYTATFSVQNNYNATNNKGYNNCGLLYLHLRRTSASTRVIDLAWELAGPNIKTDEWIATYSETNAKLTLWKKVGYRYEGYNVTCINSCTRLYSQGYGNNLTMYFSKVVNTGGDTYSEDDYDLVATSTLISTQQPTTSWTTLTNGSNVTSGTIEAKTVGDALYIRGTNVVLANSMPISPQAPFELASTTAFDFSEYQASGFVNFGAGGTYPSRVFATNYNGDNLINGFAIGSAIPSGQTCYNFLIVGAR